MDEYNVDYDIIMSDGGIIQRRNTACYADINRMTRAYNEGFTKDILNKKPEQGATMSYIATYLTTNLRCGREYGYPYSKIEGKGGQYDLFVKHVHKPFMHMLQYIAWLAPHYRYDGRHEVAYLSAEIGCDYAIQALHLIRATAEYPARAQLAVLLNTMGMPEASAVLAGMCMGSADENGLGNGNAYGGGGHCFGRNSYFNARNMKAFNNILKQDKSLAEAKKYGDSSIGMYDGYTALLKPTRANIKRVEAAEKRMHITLANDAVRHHIAAIYTTTRSFI